MNFMHPHSRLGRRRGHRGVEVWPRCHPNDPKPNYLILVTTNVGYS